MNRPDGFVYIMFRYCLCIVYILFMYFLYVIYIGRVALLQREPQIPSDKVGLFNIRSVAIPSSNLEEDIGERVYREKQNIYSKRDMCR